MPRFISRGSATPVDDFKESRMRLVDPTRLTGNPGGWGTRGFGALFTGEDQALLTIWAEPW